MHTNNDNTYFTTDKYSKLTDEEIVEKIKQDNDKEALKYLMEKYKNIVNMKVSKYFMIGAEKEDIAQEGMIGLYKAIKDFKFEDNHTFKTFANICIERQLITAIKTSNRQKHTPLNSYVSLNTAAYDNNSEDSVELLEVFNNNLMEDPLETIMKQEYYNEIQETLDKNLSKFEKQVLDRFLKGDSYVKIAERLEAPVKSVDNAIQRIRKKASNDIMKKE